MKKILIIAGLVAAVSWLWPVAGHAADTLIRTGQPAEHHWGRRGGGRWHRGGGWDRGGGWHRGGGYGNGYGGCYYR